MKKYYIGVDLGGTNIAVGLVNSDLSLVRKVSAPTKNGGDPDGIMKVMAELCLKLVNEAGLTTDDIISCGIASPGTANSDTGIVEYANNIAMLNYPIVDKLRALTGFEKIYLDNDANAAALGEAIAGSAKGATSAVVITLGTGVGGGIIIDKKIYSGFNHAGAELGHTVIEKDGRPCTCGRRGCFEAYSSATGLINITKDKMMENPDSELWKRCDGDLSKISGKSAFASMRETGDETAKEVCKEYISYLATGVANIMNIFQPEVISIGGGVSNEGDPLFEPLKTLVYKENYAKNSPRVTRIERATLGNDAGIIGAAALGADKV